MGNAEFTLGPTTGVLGQLLFRQPRWIPRQFQEELGRKLHGFEVAYIHDPYPMRAVVVCAGHLFPDLGDWEGVKPLIRPRPADILAMPADPAPPTPLLLSRLSHPP